MCNIVQFIDHLSSRIVDNQLHSKVMSHMQVFGALPENLIISVIQESSLDLIKSFKLTPPQYHSIALRARFPHITRDHSLHLAETYLSTTASTGVLGAMFKVVGGFQSLQKLTLCTSVHARVTTNTFDDLQGALCNLTHLQLLHLEGGIVAPAAVEAISQSAPFLKALTSIALHRVGVSQVAGSAKPLSLRSGDLYQALSALETLQCVSVRYMSIRHTEGNLVALTALLRTPGLKSLTLANNSLSQQELEAMAYYLTTTTETIPALEDINFSGNNFGTVGARCLVDIVRKMPTLENLDVSWNSVASQGAVHLAAALSSLEGLTHINIGGNELGDGFRSVAQTLKSLPKIEFLSLNSCRDIDGRVLGACIPFLSKLAHIDLRICNLEYDPDSVDGIYAFSMGLRQIRSLRELSIGIEDCMFDIALEVLMPRVALQEGMQKLHLKSEVNFVLAEEAEQVGDGVLQNDEDDGEGSDDGAESMVGEEEAEDDDATDLGGDGQDEAMLQTTSLDRVGQHLKNLSNLQDFSISSSLLMSKTDAQTLAEVLPTMTTLHKLCIHCKASDESPDILSRAVAKVRTLRELELCSCGITESCSAQLGYSLASLRHLKVLCLKGNKLRDAGAIVLAAHLQHVRSLRVVDLSSTKITNVGASALTEALDLQGAVETCWLQDNRIQRKTLPKRARKFSIVLGPSA